MSDQEDVERKQKSEGNVRHQRKREAVQRLLGNKELVT